MAVTQIQKVSRAINSAEAQLTTALQNFNNAVLAYNINGISAQLPANNSDPMHAGIDAQTKGEFLDQITLGANAILKLFDKESPTNAGNTLIETPELTQANAGVLVQKLGV